jgi:hypothetical protein
MTTFKAIPESTRGLRHIAREMSDEAATAAIATSRNQVEVWQEAMRKCMVAEGVSLDTSAVASQHAGASFAEINRLSTLLAKHWGFLEEYVARIDGHVSVARDVRSGHTFQVDA